MSHHSLDVFSILFLSLVNKKMLSSRHCQICGAQAGCSHSVNSKKQWTDEGHLRDIGESEITAPGLILLGCPSNEVKKNTTTVKNTMNNNQNNFIKCNICNVGVEKSFLTRHVAYHIENGIVTETNIRVSDGNDKTGKVHHLPSSSFVSTPAKQEDLVDVTIDDVRSFLSAVPATKLCSREKYNFRKIKDVSIVSGTSKDKRYSDFCVLVWLADSSTTYNTTFVGGHNSYYGKSTERVQMTVCYDSVENYFTLSNKIYKRTGYSEFDSEEGKTPDKICNQDEIVDEMRKSLLFFRVSPRGVLKRFIKNMRGSTTQIPGVGYENYISTENHLPIMESLSKKTAYSLADYDHHGMA